ncbi:BatD family protein [Pontiella sulfatireligans]|uniref:Protein BatD n=1 Tax=Pontiella sulfatireligans TaxID=2750658 RepID=A0A6C2UGT3_9BACT|nr:BatD family protein [Pontiella sulfatireligans]VGO18416.1 hypothetical protein SCARR_00469 [Pontiella sulfatireligans]
MKQRLSILLLLLFCGSHSLFAEIYVKAQIADQDKPIWVGQRVRIKIDALASDGWIGISKINLDDINGALILDRNPGGVTISETVDGQRCSGQRKEIFIYPQRNGKIRIPEFSIQVEPRAAGASTTTESINKPVPSLSFKAQLPEGAGSGTLVSTTDLKATQQWSLESTEVSVGDAVERKIRIEADDLPGMLFQPLEVEETEGLGIYRKQPSIEDRMNRGQLRGVREDSVTIVFEAAGTYIIPDISVQWFDLKSGQLKTETLQGRTFTVQGVSALADEKSGSRTLTMTAGAIVLLLLLAAGLRPMIRRKRAALQSSEWMAFQHVRRMARKDSPKALLNALLQWGDQLEEGFRLDTFLQRNGDTIALQSLELFYQSIWSNAPAQQTAFLKSMTQARRNYFRQLKKTAREQKLLPPLNP